MEQEKAPLGLVSCLGGSSVSTGRVLYSNKEETDTKPAEK